MISSWPRRSRSEEHTSELQSQSNLVCRLLLEKKKHNTTTLGPRRKKGTGTLSRFSPSPDPARVFSLRDGLTAACSCSFFFNDTATTEIYTLSLHDALPISHSRDGGTGIVRRTFLHHARCGTRRDRKSTRLNSSHSQISYAVFCLKKKK